jgi:hypothetical protein
MEAEMIQLEVLFAVGTVVLFIALLWGFVRYKTRNRANDPITEAATRAEYNHPEAYGAEEAKLKEQVRPS